MSFTRMNVYTDSYVTTQQFTFDKLRRLNAHHE